jgi:uncharacterized protein YybS (DUF2232 family)
VTKPEGTSTGSGPAAVKESLVLGAVYLLPQLHPGFIWVQLLLAVPIFYILETKGQRGGIRCIRNGLLLAAVGSILLKQPISFLLSLIMVPLGFSLYRSCQIGLDPWKTGVRGLFILSLGWIVSMVIYGIALHANPYGELLGFLDQVIIQYHDTYIKVRELPPEIGIKPEDVLPLLRTILPKVVPGLLVSSLVATVWLNLLLCANLLNVMQPERNNWPAYRFWKIPSNVVWLLIGGVVLLLLSDGRFIELGFGVTTLGCLLFCFQGLAVASFQMEKWKLPPFLRFLIYLFLVIQQAGLILLLIFALVDIWMDFRKINSPGNGEQ